MRTEAILAVEGYDLDRLRLLHYDLWVRLEAAGHTFLSSDRITAYKRLHKRQSFEHSAHLSYGWKAQMLRLKSCPTWWEKIAILPSVALKAVWSALPRRVRMIIQQWRIRRHGVQEHT